MNKNLKRFLPFGILLVLILLVYLTNVYHIFTVDWFEKEEIRLSSYAKVHPFLSRLLYLSIYIVSVLLAIPDSILLTLLGAMIFPYIEAFLLAIIAETIGATLFFAIFHTTFGTPLLGKEHALLKKLRRGFTKHKISYLLFLRISHIIPFWVTNIGAAYFKIKYWTFIWTTFLGLIPVTYVVANAGHSLSIALAQHRIRNLTDIFTPQVKVALFALGALALCPILLKKFIRRK